MVNNQTSQYELLDKKIYLSRLGIFQCIREILQLSLPIDHPVAPLVTYPPRVNPGSRQNTVICNPTLYISIASEKIMQ